MLIDFIDTNGTKKAKYDEIYTQIANAINSDKLKIGEKLPSIREASAQLNVSRTTIENAYIKLCIEGLAESQPHKGYFVCKKVNTHILSCIENQIKTNIIYDFSSQKIDLKSADIDIWKKTVRYILNDSEKLISYGDPKGELELRQVLAQYSFRARGVRCGPENVVIGAGIGPLINIICGLIGKDNRVAVESGGFKLAQNIFNDYGIDCKTIFSDSSGVIISQLNSSDSNILMLMPSQLSKISVSELNNRRKDISCWVTKKSGRLIIEDDYNGELRYTARSVSAFQGKDPEHTIYIGSFSKLLLPSVRIAYMVLPDDLSNMFNEKQRYYNQTAGKVDQLALAQYIKNGGIERHLRRLRKLYYQKSQVLCEAIRKHLNSVSGYNLYETSLSIVINTVYNIQSSKLCSLALEYGIKLIDTHITGQVMLCFAGINFDDIEPAIVLLNKCWVQQFDKF